MHKRNSFDTSSNVRSGEFCNELSPHWFWLEQIHLKKGLHLYSSISVAYPAMGFGGGGVHGLFGNPLGLQLILPIRITNDFHNKTNYWLGFKTWKMASAETLNAHTFEYTSEWVSFVRFKLLRNVSVSFVTSDMFSGRDVTATLKLDIMTVLRLFTRSVFRPLFCQKKKKK